MPASLATRMADHRAFMAMFPTGVAVVTASAADGGPRGMTCSSICSVTLDPPTLLVCIWSGSPTGAAVRETGAFAVNLLHAEARPTAELFASGAPDRFECVRWSRTERGGAPHLADAHAIADFEVTRSMAVGDHRVIFGESLRVLWPYHPGGTTPLLYGLRRFGSWSPDGATAGVDRITTRD